ncbi:MAG: transporter, partial [Syntrophomonadaceae bacterium]|nr:transporter [Syntrophomonadaceae bacterium]
MNSNLMFLLSSVILGAVGQVLLKMGVNHLGRINLNWPALIPTIFDIFTNIWIITGICCFVSSMILWIKVISGMELSKAYPSVSIS